MASEEAPELGMRPSFLSTFGMATDQVSKLGMGKNTKIVCVQDTYQEHKMAENRRIAAEKQAKKEHKMAEDRRIAAEKQAKKTNPVHKETKMALTLKAHIVEQIIEIMLQFDPATMVYDALNIIRENTTEANLGQPKDYGLFLAGDEGAGIWLENGRQLGYYLLRNQDVIEYRRKVCAHKVRMLDGAVKTIMMDISQPVSQLMPVICTEIGIMNHDEYSLVLELTEEEALTLRKWEEENKYRRDVKMEKIKNKLRTEYEINWVDHSWNLREQGIDECGGLLLLRQKYFFSDQNIDHNDPVQLNLLYVQCRDAILDGSHTVTEKNCCEFAGIQCQIQFGDHVDQKYRAGYLNLKEFLPQWYLKNKGIEKKIWSDHKKFDGKGELDAKVDYVSLAQSLKTYGVTFFLVKEKIKGKKKWVLLGVTKDSVLMLDVKTKEILKTWPLTTLLRYAAEPNTFTLDFGDYAGQYFYQKTEGEYIIEYIEGYKDFILKKQLLKTYGGTFYLVKEVIKGMGKGVLLGVTKDSVLMLDVKTKEILKTWPLTTLLRYAAEPNTFTLDFGDYGGQYYYQTTEGEFISDLIEGYKDFILKKQRVLEQQSIEGDDGATLGEELSGLLSIKK